MCISNRSPTGGLTEASPAGVAFFLHLPSSHRFSAGSQTAMGVWLDVQSHNVTVGQGACGVPPALTMGNAGADQTSSRLGSVDGVSRVAIAIRLSQSVGAAGQAEEGQVSELPQ